ncbi:MAG TPA: DUF2461 domain-containing protein [Draconibacterium sp.]|nr:DUF2461 domain-containing protein [Draconibacterium sp.]
MLQVIQFLQDLTENNNREWFQNNKKRYDESREKVLFITEVVINEIRKFDSEIPLLEPKDCLFRIFRDVRFSNDKRPYKTNFGSFIAKGGRKSMHAGYYFHIEPEGSFVGGGIYMPAAEPLKAIREYIAENGEEFLSIIGNKEFKKVYPEMMDDKLKTAPKGYSPDHEFIDLLRYKSFAFSSRFEKSDILADNYIEKLVQSFKTLHPVNRFLNEALEHNL